MTDKDPKDMTVSEQLRWAANGEPYNGIDENIWTYPTGKIRALAEAVTGEWPSDNEIFSIIADKIDAELAQARELSLLRGAELWAKANGWPDFREGEDFGQWLERCFLPRPRYEDGEIAKAEDFGLGCTGYFTVHDSGEWHLKSILRNGDIALGFVDERVERPLLDRDGVAIIKGCTVWDIYGRGPIVVQRIGTVDESDVPVVFDEHGTWTEPHLLTHKRPAPGADGLPIKVGETVWGILSATKGIVNSLNDDSTAYVEWDDGRWSPCIDCCNLTHTPPDTQERIDEDARKTTYGYWRCGDFSCGECPSEIDGKKPYERYNCPEDCFTSMKLDLLRRQRELDKRTGGAE